MIVAKKKTKWMILAIGTGLLCLGAWLAFSQTRHSNRVPPRMGPVVEAVYGLGTVVSPQTFQVKSAVNQDILEIFVKEGDEVQKGTPLLRLSESGVQRAPFAGTVTSIPFKKGEILFPSAPILTLVNLDHIYLEVSLEQQAVIRVQRGQKAFVSVESIRGDKISGSVESVFPRDAQFMVRINVEKLPQGVLPGMTADVAIEVGRKENVLTIPLTSISSGKVTLIRSGKTLKVGVQIGVIDREWAEVTSGNILSTDEILVRDK